MININQCFDEEGNFVDHVNPFQDCDHPVIQFLFDSDGYATKTREVEKLINENNWSWKCDAVKYFYSRDIDHGCKGNYTAVFAWR